MSDQKAYHELFPCRRVPAEGAVRKLIGLYEQARDDLWLQRVKVPGGRPGAEQWQVLADAAARFTPRTPLHLTTRQDVEIHDLTAEMIPPLQESLWRGGLTCLGAAGDTYRNIAVCPCSGTAAGAVDLMPLAGLIERELKGTEGIYTLPRKFKISLSCGAGCGQPWIHGIGFVAVNRGGAWGFKVVVGGSLGARPGTGMLLFDWLGASDVLPLLAAVIGVFAARGDRANRSKARLRHVRERMGNEAFGQLLVDAFERAKARRSWPRVCLEPSGRFGSRRTLTFPNGDVTVAMAEALGRIEADERFAVRIGSHHRVAVFGRDEDSLAGELARHPSLSRAAEAQPAVVACPGRRWCRRAIVHTNELADRIRNELADDLPAGATVCISGCPNGCSQARVADVGLLGAAISSPDGRREAFRLFAGGGMGRDGALAAPDGGKLTADEALARIRRLCRAGADQADRTRGDGGDRDEQ